jgi:hypothetical protein
METKIYVCSVEAYVAKGDCWISHLSWDEVHDAAVGDYATPPLSNGAYCIATKCAVGQYVICRSALAANTNDLANYAIVAARLYLFRSTGTPPVHDDSTDMVVVPGGFQASGPVVADYGPMGAQITNCGQIASADWAAGWNAIELNANGLAQINKNGVTRLGLRDSLDISDTEPTGANFWWTGATPWGLNHAYLEVDAMPVSPPPEKVNPATGHPGDALSVVITGTDFTGATDVSFGGDITVDSFTVDSATQITASITIAPTAADGYCTVAVTTPSGTGEKVDGFAALEKYAPPVPPSESAPVHGGIYGPGPGSGGYNVNFGGAGNFLGFLTGWRSLTVKRVVNGPAQATIELDGYHDAIPLLNLDAQVQMWRANPLLGIKAYKECDLLFQSGRFDWDSQAQSVFIATLVGPENLLERRILLGGDDQPYCAGGYSAEQAMKQLVQVQCGLSGMRNLISGAMPGLSVAPDQNRGSMWSGYQLGEKLLTYLQGIAEAKSMAFKVTSSVPGQFVFDAYPTPYGADRTASNINPATGRNAAGNTPVIFSQQRGNVAAMSYINKRTGEGNVAIDIDAGQVFASAGETDSPWNHREFAINPGADESTEDYAAGALEKMKATEDIELTIVQTPTCAYGKDYFLGDWVSLYVSGPKIKKTMHKVITSVTWTVRPQQGQPDEQIAIELSSGNIIKRDALQEILANYNNRIKRLEMNQ